MTPYLSGPLVRAVEEMLALKGQARRQDDRGLLQQISIDVEIALKMLITDADIGFRQHIREVIAEIEGEKLALPRAPSKVQALAMSAWALRSLSAHQLLVLTTLAAAADPVKETAFVSAADIAPELHMAVADVHDVIVELVAAHYLKLKWSPGKQCYGYHLTLPEARA